MVEQLSLVEVDEVAAEIKPPKIEKRTVKERRQQVLTVLTHMPVSYTHLQCNCSESKQPSNCR